MPAIRRLRLRAGRRHCVSAINRFGPRGGAARMAQEFGDHPEAAAARMRWARQLPA
jgi:hypothetical protein